MGVWADRVVPHIVEKAGSNPHVETAARPGVRGPARPGAGDRLRQRAERRPLPRRGRVRARRGALRRRLAAVRGAAGVDASLPIERLGAGRPAAGRAGLSPFDCVLSTFTLCTIPDVHRALRRGTPRAAARRAAALPRARARAGPDGGDAWQRRLDPLQGRLFAGCHLSRDIPALVRGAGLQVDAARGELPARARARAPAGATATSAVPASTTDRSESPSEAAVELLGWPCAALGTARGVRRSGAAAAASSLAIVTTLDRRPRRACRATGRPATTWPNAAFGGNR